MGEDYGNQRIYDRSPDGAPVGARLSAGSRYYYIEDVLGSVVGMFDKDGNYYGGYAYGPYGEARYMSGNIALSNNHLRYTGGYFDTSNNLYLLGARYYDASTGRFTQTDPAAADSNPYAYVGDSPISNIDPDGLKKKKSFWKTVAYIATVVAGVLAAAEWFICPELVTACLIVKAAVFFADALSTVISCASGSITEGMLGIVSTAIDIIGLPSGIAKKFLKIAKKAIVRITEITENIIHGEATVLSSYSALVSLADLFT